MYKLVVYNNEELVLRHEQPNFTDVLKFAIEATAKAINMNLKDYRINMEDKEGNTYYYAIGKETQIVGLRKKGTPNPE